MFKIPSSLKIFGAFLPVSVRLRRGLSGLERHSASCLLKPCAHHLITDSFLKKKKKKRKGKKLKHTYTNQLIQ